MKLNKIFFLILATSVFFNSYSQSNNSDRKDFKILGSVTEDFNGYLYLYYNDIVDSALVENQQFTFKGRVYYPTSATIRKKSGVQGNLPLYIENTDIQIAVSIDGNDVYIMSIEGTKTSKIISSLFSYFEVIQSDPKFASKIYDRLDTIITENPRNQFSGFILAEIAMDPILNYEQVYSLFNKLDTTVQEHSELTSIKKSMRKLKNIRIGTTLSNIELPNTQGNMINTKDLKASVTLIEFWASWCVPCREANPELVKLYNQYNKRGFEIFGVSSDKRKDAWLKAIKDDNLTWVNTFAEGGFENDVMRTLGIQYLPSNFLIDKKGKILAINIKPSELEQTLKQTFN